MLIVAAMFVTTLSAQEWSLGGRVGSGIQAVGQYTFSNENYLEARFGASWNNPEVWVAYSDGTIKEGRVMADFTLLYNWHILEMDWTPSTGIWFFDAGVGVNVGGKPHYAYVGVAGSARLGLKFHNAPVSLAFDWTPSFGPGILYVGNQNEAMFNELGLANVGISCVYHF